MTFPKVRLVVAATLFLAWIGFLFFQVVESRSIVLSKPQFMVAPLVVVAQLSDKAGSAEGEVTITRVLFPKGLEALAGKKVHLPELAACTKAYGYLGAGEYLLPLSEVRGGFEVTPLPRFAGGKMPANVGSVEWFGVFSRHFAYRLPIDEARNLNNIKEFGGYRPVFRTEEIRIYPWTLDTEAQVERLLTSANR